MEYTSVFDIIGPVMVGPSSSHTAGAARIGKLAHDLFVSPIERAIITFYGSFAETYRGHGSDVAVVAGLLGFQPFNEKLKDSLNIAKDVGLEIEFQTSSKSTAHPNTVKIEMYGKRDSDESSILVMTIVGQSIGGGKINIIEIDSFKTQLSNDYPTMLVFHKNEHGAIAQVSNVFAENNINIARMNVARTPRGQTALMTIEVDQKIDDTIVSKIECLPLIHRTIII